MASLSKDVTRFEATAVCMHPEAKVDIILVHGLNGDPKRTWTAKNEVFWPADLLPQSLKDTPANVLVYGYNADVYSKRHGASPSDNFIILHAQTLVTSLTAYRRDVGTSRNPILWVAHSLGGILVKRALLYSNDLKAQQHEDYRSLFVSTYGIIFLGTPHTGSVLGGWAAMLQAMSDVVVPRAFWQSESVLLKTLKKDNETLQNINNHFLDIYQRFQILMVHENHKTDLKGTYTLIVDAESASPQLPGVAYYAIEATHSGMCKFDGMAAPGYRTVASFLREWIGQAPGVVATRWRVEQDERLSRAKHDIEERMKPWLASTHAAPEGRFGPVQDRIEIRRQGQVSGPSLQSSDYPSQESKSEHLSATEPVLFVKPTVFRPNTFFSGRDEELGELHRRLMDRHLRSKGTSSVLIQSMPGGGKTHLARQYVFKHKNNHPGGVFWIRSKTMQELTLGYWDIARMAGLEESKQLDREGVDDMRMVQVVQHWLSSTEYWLLILDGVHFDLPDLKKFIPFARHTSIIYTSTEKTAGDDYKFDNPHIIALEPLKAREAQELLLEEMGKKKPWNSDDLSRALELVQLMERLPLMIHVAALHLKATREPLSKYLRSYRSRPKAGTLPAYRAVREQLYDRGDIAALNLMSMLSFFGQYVPVEMIVLGLRALDKRTPVKTADTQTRKLTLNNTFKVLIAFALLERNESHDSPHDSQDSHGVDMGQDSLDTLRIHSIVQAFFVDILAEEKQAPFWLERAIRIFCRAFDESDRRIREERTTGMPEDYRRFSIHGKKLLAYLDRFEKKARELGEVREMLEDQLSKIQDKISELTRRLKGAGNRSLGDTPIVSVFERTNSLSEMDSETPPSNNSLDEWRIDEDDGSPPKLGSDERQGRTAYNPYHWHVSYPYGLHTPQDLETSRSVTPRQGPTEIFNSIPAPVDEEPRRPPRPIHRTVKKADLRRYRDHAGSRRTSSQILSDPRVSLSRETAKGVIAPPQQPMHGGKVSRSRSHGDKGLLMASGDAETNLNRIALMSPPPPGKEGPSMAEKTQSLSASSSARPKIIVGRSSYAATAQTAVEDNHPITPTFSNVTGAFPPPLSSFTAATILRMKENERPVSVEGLVPVKVSSPLASGPLAVSTTAYPSDPQSPPTNGWSTQNLARSPLGPSVSLHEDGSWLTEWTARGQSDSRIPRYHRDQRGHAHSLPSILPYPDTIPIRSSSQLNVPQGHTSQPMSRETSGGEVKATSSSLSPQAMQGAESRRPSLVETEPSPRLGQAGGFEVQNTSYQLYGGWTRRKSSASSGTSGGFFARLRGRTRSRRSELDTGNRVAEVESQSVPRTTEGVGVMSDTANDDGTSGLAGAGTGAGAGAGAGTGAGDGDGAGAGAGHDVGLGIAGLE